MADTKISALHSASTPLAGTEVLPIVQSSATVKVSVDNLTTGKNVPASDVTLAKSGNPVLSVHNTASSETGYITTNPSGVVGLRLYTEYYNIELEPDINYQSRNVLVKNSNVVMSTAAKGINFTANTPLAGMTSQLLNWYEEGTFTPTILGDTNPTVTYTAQTGKYTRIGNLMHFSAVISWSALSGGTGNIRIQMPKAANGSQTGFMVGIASGLSTVSLIGAVDNGWDSFYLRDTTTNNGGVNVSGLGASGTFIISGTYFV